MALPGATHDCPRDTRCPPPLPIFLGADLIGGGHPGPNRSAPAAAADDAVRQAARDRCSAGRMLVSYAVSADAIAMCMSRYW